MKILCILCLILLGAATGGYSQVADSLEQTLRVDTTQTVSAPITPIQNSSADATDDFSPALAVGALLVGSFMLYCIGTGIVLMGIFLGVLFGLVATGILSASLLVSLKTKSVTAGAKTFWVLGSTSASLVVGAVALGILDRVGGVAMSTKMAMLLGALSGAVAGFVVAQIAWWAGRRLLRYAQRRLLTAR